MCISGQYYYSSVIEIYDLVCGIGYSDEGLYSSIIVI